MFDLFNYYISLLRVLNYISIPNLAITKLVTSFILRKWHCRYNLIVILDAQTCRITPIRLYAFAKCLADNKS